MSCPSIAVSASSASSTKQRKISKPSSEAEKRRAVRNPKTGRKKTSIACQHCWKSKTRCGIKRPCDRCVRLGHNDCSDRPESTRKRQHTTATRRHQDEKKKKKGKTNKKGPSPEVLQEVAKINNNTKLNNNHSNHSLNTIILNEYGNPKNVINTAHNHQNHQSQQQVIINTFPNHHSHGHNTNQVMTNHIVNNHCPPLLSAHNHHGHVDGKIHIHHHGLPPFIPTTINSNQIPPALVNLNTTTNINHPQNITTNPTILQIPGGYIASSSSNLLSSHHTQCTPHQSHQSHLIAINSNNSDNTLNTNNTLPITSTHNNNISTPMGLAPLAPLPKHLTIPNMTISPIPSPMINPLNISNIPPMVNLPTTTTFNSMIGGVNGVNSSSSTSNVLQTNSTQDTTNDIKIEIGKKEKGKKKRKSRHNTKVPISSKSKSSSKRGRKPKNKNESSKNNNNNKNEDSMTEIKPKKRGRGRPRLTEKEKEQRQRQRENQIQKSKKKKTRKRKRKEFEFQDDDNNDNNNNNNNDNSNDDKEVQFKNSNDDDDDKENNNHLNKIQSPQKKRKTEIHDNESADNEMDDECINEKIRKYKDNPLMLYWDQRHKGIHPDDSSHYSTEYDSDDDDEDHDAFIISLKRDSKQSPVKLSKIAPIKTKEPLNKIDNMKHEESESEKSGKNLKGNAAWNDFAFSRGSINNHKNTQFPFKQMFGRSGSSSSSSSSCTSIPSELPLESQESQQRLIKQQYEESFAKETTVDRDLREILQNARIPIGIRANPNKIGNNGNTKRNVRKFTHYDQDQHQSQESKSNNMEHGQSQIHSQCQQQMIGIPVIRSISNGIPTSLNLSGILTPFIPPPSTMMTLAAKIGNNNTTQFNGPSSYYNPLNMVDTTPINILTPLIPSPTSSNSLSLIAINSNNSNNNNNNNNKNNHQLSSRTSTKSPSSPTSMLINI